jgi:hypothetical protein
MSVVGVQAGSDSVLAVSRIGHGGSNEELHRPVVAQSTAVLSRADDFDCRAVIALNNTGVSLLERGAFPQALQTFKDSIAVLKRVLRGRRPSSLHDNRDAEVQNMLDLAEKRLASSFLPNSSTSCWPLASVYTVSHDGTTFSALPITADHIYSFEYIPVRIECTTADLPFHSGNVTSAILRRRDADFESSLVLYNFALAHLSLADDVLRRRAMIPMEQSQQRAIQYARTLRQHAMRLLRMVYGILISSDAVRFPSQAGVVIRYLWMEEAQLTLTCLCLARINAHCTEEHETSYRLSLAVHAWPDWRFRLAVLLGSAAGWSDLTAGPPPNCKHPLEMPMGRRPPLDQSMTVARAA